MVPISAHLPSISLEWHNTAPIIGLKTKIASNHNRRVSTPCVIGVDLGGTNVRAQAIHRDGTPAGQRFQQPSQAQEGTELIFDALTTVIRQAVAAAETPPARIGIAIPGFVDDATGMVHWAPNFGIHKDGIFHYWTDIPIGTALRQRIDIPISIGNDANLAALGEYQYGAGGGQAKCLVMLTLGTGLGGGVVLGPASLQGAVNSPVVLLGGNKGGVELGHLLFNPNGLDCNAGSYGALEAYVARDSIVQRAIHKLRRGNESLIDELVDGDWPKITPRTITEACERGDAVALETFEEVGIVLGAAMGSLINIFAPDKFIIGGQISKAGEYLLGPARKEAKKVAIPALMKFASIELATHVEDAGMLGAAALAFQALDIESAHAS